MSPRPSSFSDPLASRIVLESIFDDTRNEMRAGRFALMRPGDDVDRRPLCGENQMDADGARHLCEPADRLLHFVAGHHHQVCELVDHHDDEGQRTRRLADSASSPPCALIRMLRLYCSMFRTCSAAIVL